MLVDLLESIEHFLKRLDVYMNIPRTPAMTEIFIKILVELLSTLGLVTKQIKQKRFGELPPSLTAPWLKTSQSQICEGTFRGE